MTSQGLATRFRALLEIRFSLVFKGANSCLTTTENAPITDDKQELERLGARLRKARGESLDETVTADTGATDGSLLGMAWRLSTELMAAVVVGSAMGWAIDHFSGVTAPWGIVGGLLLGMVTGIRNVFRTAARMEAEQNALSDAPASKE